jgi:heat shock protein HslJ
MYKSFFALIIIVAILNGCSSVNKTTELGESRWVATSLLGKTLTDNEAAKKLPSINFGENGKLFGSTGCNNYTGFFKIKDNTISLSPGSMTKMMCSGNVEQNFLNAIRQATKYRLDGDRLDLLNGTKTVMSLVKQRDNSF